MPGVLDPPLSARQASDIVGAAVTDVIVRTGGQLSTVYEVRCAEPVGSVIVKVYAEQWRWKLAKEVHVYRLLAEAGVGPIPGSCERSRTRRCSAVRSR
jgi:hygromycin-B 7''-O-kinase